MNYDKKNKRISVSFKNNSCDQLIYDFLMNKSSISIYIKDLILNDINNVSTGNCNINNSNSNVSFVPKENKITNKIENNKISNDNSFDLDDLDDFTFLSIET